MPVLATSSDEEPPKQAIYISKFSTDPAEFTTFYDNST
jgi:hypothetical protein